MEKEMDEGLKEICSAKSDLRDIIECYKYLLDGACKAKIDKAIN